MEKPKDEAKKKIIKRNTLGDTKNQSSSKTTESKANERLVNEELQKWEEEKNNINSKFRPL